MRILASRLEWCVDTDGWQIRKNAQRINDISKYRYITTKYNLDDLLVFDKIGIVKVLGIWTDTNNDIIYRVNFIGDICEDDTRILCRLCGVR